MIAALFAGSVSFATAAHVVHNKNQNSGLRASSSVAMYGSGGCPCVGFDNTKGEVQVLISDKVGKRPFPAEAGASCAKWDILGPHPDCEQGTDLNYTRKNDKDPSWCFQSWCYVDPCKCDLGTPVVSAYLPDATYQGHPVYYSYDTCGGKDSYTASSHKTACVNQKTEAACTALPKCAWNGATCAGKEIHGVCSKPGNAAELGAENCRCIGIDKLEGSIEADVGKGKMAFPASYGAQCAAHDQTLHPDCKGADPPEWCGKAWCWIDPCSCKQQEPPKVTAGWMGPTVNFQGKTLYYSYTTCGAEDLFTEKYHKAACMNQKSAAQCASLGAKCTWVEADKRCLGKELASECGWYKASALTMAPLSALLLVLTFQFW